MADITTDLPRGSRAPAFRLKIYQWMLLGVLACGCRVAVNEASAKDRCDMMIGRLAVRLKMDQYYSSCHCMKPSLDFSDPCNSMYLPAIL